MKQEISITSSTTAHYEDILRIFNEGFSAKLGFVTQKEDQQLSFARDFGIFELESSDQDFVAIVNGRVVGFLSLKFSRQYKRRSTKGLSNRELFRKYGLASILKAILFGATFYHKLKEGELYIDTVGVATEARGGGIGTCLLGFAESFAKQRSLTKLSLSVVYENPKAKALYERSGYQVQSSHSLWWMNRSTGISGTYYMVKDI